MTPAIRRVHLRSLSSSARSRITRRSATPDPDVLSKAAEIVRAVAERGDDALVEYSDRFGGTPSSASVRVPDRVIVAASMSVSERERSAIAHAIRNVEAVHRDQRPLSTMVRPEAGVEVERVWAPVASAGVYVPGGRATYPSSLIMGVVPARIAGVARIVVATPADEKGQIDALVLAAADALGVDDVYAMGGAQAIGALAYGTGSIPRVDVIVGPGGPWVTAAKLAVAGVVGIDLPAGPSEAAIVADAAADVRLVAADVMCQAEHGSESSVILVVPDDAMADAVLTEIGRVLPGLTRSPIILEALEDHGLIAVSDDLTDGLAFANEWAPEHLSLHTDSVSDAVDRVPNAGSVFVGRWTPEAAGDYATGANHVLPTGGLARARGPLGVEDFGSWRQIQRLDRDGLERLSGTISTLAMAEGLTAHAYSVAVRLEEAS